MSLRLEENTWGHLGAGQWVPGKMAVKEATARLHAPAHLSVASFHIMENVSNTKPLLEKRK